MLGMTVPIERMIRVTAVRWYGSILLRKEGNILKKALNYEVTGKRKGGRSKAT